MVIPQVFGSSSVLYRVASPLFVIMLFVSAALRGCTGDALHDQCIKLVVSSSGAVGRRLTSACAGGIGSSDDMPSQAHAITDRVWYGTIPVRCRKRRRPPTTKLGAVAIASKAATRPRSGTLVGAHRAGSPAPIKRGCQIDACRASVDASTFHV